MSKRRWKPIGGVIVDIATGKTLGVVIADLDLNVVREDVSNVRLLESSEIIMPNQEESIIYHPRLETGGKLSASSIYPGGDSSNFVLKETAQSKPFLYLRSPINELGWTLYAIVPYQVVYQKLSLIRYYFIGFVFLLMLIVSFVSVPLKKLFVIPIWTLQRLMAK